MFKILRFYMFFDFIFLEFFLMKKMYMFNILFKKVSYFLK